MKADALHSHQALARAAIVVLGCTLGTAAFAAEPGLKREGPLTILTFPQSQPPVDAIDYVHAKTKELPIAANYSEEMARADLIGLLASHATAPAGEPGFSPGADGDGKTSPVFLGVPAADSGGVSPEEAGTSNLPFSTARADGATGTTNKIYPFRAAGRLFFQEGGSTFVCSASLIKKGIVVTAAHCVATFGQKQFHSNFHFVPGYRSGVAPFGNWTAKAAFVLTAYFNGTDPCSQKGVVCQDDVALLVLNPQSGTFPGISTGWYGFAWNGVGFTSTGLTHVTQIGYPVCLDNGELMERNDSQGFKSASNSNNTIIGTLMCGGSSGGPWLINFGQRPTLTGTTNGSSAEVNTVVGVTSWGATSTAPKVSGASPFLNTNILTLVNAACGADPANC